MLNIFRTFQLGSHRFFSLYLFSAWNLRDRDASTAPQLHNTPPTREKAAAALRPYRQEFESQKVQSHKGFSTWDTASGTEADITTKAQMMPHFSFVHRNGSNSFILKAANYIDANISVMLLC